MRKIKEIQEVTSETLQAFYDEKYKIYASMDAAERLEILCDSMQDAIDSGFSRRR